MRFGFFKDTGTKNDRLLVGLDIGTSKICAAVGEVCDTGLPGGRDVNIIGLGVAPSKGIKKGVVTNIESTVESIKEAIAKAETMAGVEIKAVQIGISGEHIDCFSSHGIIAVKEDEIGQREVDSVMDAAKAVAIPFDREILHVIPAGFTINGQNGITDPRGMAGVRLETNVRIITGAATSVRNLVRSCQKAGLEVLDVVVQPLASAEAVLSQDEKDLGTVVIDIGGGTTGIAIFHEGSICHSAVLAIGGNNFTNDVAIGLRISTHEAERIKKEHGCSMLSLLKGDEEIDVGSEDERSNRRIPRRYLVEILQPRAEELFSMIREEITGRGFYRKMSSGVVLTGGAVLMEGMDVMAENILELPVRIGVPAGMKDLREAAGDPSYAAAVGLAVFGAEDNLAAQGINKGNVLDGMSSRLKGWFSETFK
ncbi:MAG: cell division protein FtsA [Nitrospirota bacterium]|nr:cell division protein FtsA [Nitrospirota bacterium]